MRILKFLIVIALIGAAFGGGYVFRATRQTKPAPATRTVRYWVDPMHPAYTSDKPGTAPDCGMALEPVYEDATPANARAASSRPVRFYRDPKAPAYTADTPGLNPETGNTLEPVYVDDPSGGIEGTIRITPERQQLIGLRFAAVEPGPTTRAIRTVGRVAVDETRVGHVHTRIEGWIDHVMVDVTGATVKKGTPMLAIYSPEMLASQQELLLAERARDLMQANPLASAASHGASLFEAAKRRLQLWDLSDDQIARVLATGQPIRTIVVAAPMDGVVTARNAFPNQKVTPDSDLYTITDLSAVWIVADVFESDVASLRVGDPAYVIFPTGQAPSLAARVSFIQPQVDPATRTLKVRLDVKNAGLRMKPDMYVDVEFGVVTPARLSVPVDAVLDSGGRQTVFVDLGNGYLEPRAVTVAERIGDRAVVTAGLTAGERVVASGTFLVDSESRLRSAVRGMGAPGGARK